MRSSAALALSDDGVDRWSGLDNLLFRHLAFFDGVWGRTLLRYRDETPVNG